MSEVAPVEALASVTLATYLDRLAARTPAPGGGAVAATTLATAAALGRMVLAYTIGKARYAADDARHRAVESMLAEAQVEFLRLADDDAVAYAALNELLRLAPEAQAADPRRALVVQRAIDVPARMATLGVESLEALRGLAGTTSPLLESDRVIAVDLAGAGVRSAVANVRVNLPLLPETERAALAASIASWLDAAE